MANNVVSKSTHARSNRAAPVEVFGRYAEVGTAAVLKTAGRKMPTEVRFLYLP